MPEWNELFHKEEHRWKEPYPLVEEFAGVLAAQPGAHVLDLGSGAGRHLIYLRKQGFHLFGLDSAGVGLSESCRWLEKEQLSAELTQGDMTALPYADAAFDALISIHVIFHNPLALVQRSLCEIRRVVRPGGWIALTFQSTRNYRYRNGIELEPDTFVPEIGADAGIPHHYSDFADAARLVGDFDVRKVEHEEHRNEEGQRSAHWNILMVRPVEK